MDRNLCQLVVTGLQGKRDVIRVATNCTIDNLYAEVKRVCAASVSVEELRLVYGGSELERGKGQTIEDYDIPPMGQIFMVIRLRGGGPTGSIWVRLPLIVCSLTANDIILDSIDPDIITLDSDSVELRIRMPCGHAIGAGSLLDYCNNLLDGGQIRFQCPLCSHEWSYGFIRKALKRRGLSGKVEQLDQRMTEVSLAKITGFQKCPGSCSVWMYRDPSEPTCLIHCPLCSYDYCWMCLRRWNSSGIYCGNSDCQMGFDPRIRFLTAQPLKTIGQVPGCPSVRGCPGCGTLLEHREACKHMACRSCNLKFCFVCLKPFIVATQQWQCGAHNTPCPVAPIQTTLASRQ